MPTVYLAVLPCADVCGCNGVYGLVFKIWQDMGVEDTFSIVKCALPYSV